MIDNLPKVTVVTVCFNAADVIQKTMDSVLEQTYPSIEYLIIDGYSKDNTLDLVKSMEPFFLERGCEFRITSEKDRGIYDAMNKGISQASGKWICFMNAGDVFSDPDVISKAFCDDPEEVVLYGDTIVEKSFGNICMKPKSLDCLKKKMPFCHQSVFVPASVLKKHPFQLDFRIVADYKFFYDYYQRGGKFRYLDFPVSNFEAEQGLSSSSALRANKEKALVNGRYHTV
ncbi:MAG: glycosyltransferase family 2 protein, partial [Bacteroidales bacterium]